MAGEKTLEELEQAVRWQSDQDGAALRHSSSDVRRIINQSIKRYRELLTDNGSHHWLRSHTAVTDVGPTSVDGQILAWGKYALDSIQPQVCRIWGIDLSVDNVMYELDAVSFKERNRYPWVSATNGPPTDFFVYDETSLALMPPPDRAYDMVIWYLPVFEDLKDDDDVFNPRIAGGEEWVVWDTVHKLAVRDNYVKTIRSAMDSKDRIMKELVHRAVAHRVGPVKRLDTRGRSQAKRHLRFWYGRTGNS